MRNRKWIALLLAALLLAALLLTGCGKAAEPTTVPTTETPTTEAPTTVPTEPPMDAKTVLDNMLVAAEKYPVTEMDMEMVMDAEIDLVSMGMSMDMKMDLSGHTVVNQDRTAAYAQMETNISVMGENTKQTSQTYIVTENDTVMTYTHDETTGAWTSAETPEALKELSTTDSMIETYRSLTAEFLTMEEETQQLDGREVYVLHCTVPGDVMDMDMAGMDELLESTGMSLDNFDLSALEISQTIYVDAETFQQRKMEMDLSSMGDIMNSLIGNLLGAQEGTEGMEMEIILNTFSMTESNMCYDAVEVPALPDEARELANQPVVVFYPIEEGEITLEVPCPVGYTYVEGDYYYAGFANADQTHLIYYSLYTDAEFTEYFGKGDAAGFALAEDCQSYGAGPDIQGFKTLWGVSEGTNCYYGWGQVGGCKLVVESYDALPESTLEAAMTALLGEIVFPTETM